ncbi:hypothetical protein CLV24_102266 [Pontibacter ummariensis]|uniref:Uncharacterized protein n=1 Tax=Pontibacter ummariensis TaxID=1610492 RepID=A0A239BTZ5_9BACT|nr:hypothetical protein [Pontibacter ummariensis]PRY15644.1 hypothetical protein CLV24_102266 [Pontibacter ummariensis]SNS10898.1 hypothetical protein SAMN06296052_102146 [Pontibacter ummariensis]
MRPEDIDKLFKERLGNSTPPPPGDLWNRLQQRMEEEKEAKPLLLFPTQEQEKKRSFMWVYSSVAATLSLLLTVGVVFYNVKTGTPEISETLTKEERLQLQEAPAFKIPVPEETVAGIEEAKESAPPEKNFNTEATAAKSVASKQVAALDKPKAEAETGTKVLQNSRPTKQVKHSRTKAITQPALAVNKPEVANKATEAVQEPAAQPTATVSLAEAKTANADLNAAPVEITIKRSVASPASVAEAEQPSGIDKKAKLAKNIFKQVRNLANGEGVELSELGIRADRIALETQIGKQKISKVIQL